MLFPDCRVLLEPFFQAALPPAPGRARPLVERAMDFRAVLWRAEKHVAFFGAFKAGKSTLINALIGAPLLPARANRATGVVTRISHGDRPAAQVLTGSGNAARLRTIGLGEIAAHILLDVSAAGGARAPDVEEVRVQLPLALLRGGCVLVDTPGLLDDVALSERAVREMAQSDLAVMVLSAEKILHRREREAAAAINALLGGNVVFVVNRLNLVDEADGREIMDHARAALRGVGNALVGRPRVLAVNARGALEARKAGSGQACGPAAPAAWPRPAAAELLALEGCLERWAGPQGDQITLRSRLCVLGGLLVEARAALAGEAEEARAKTGAIVERLRAAHVSPDNIQEPSFTVNAAARLHPRAGIKYLSAPRQRADVGLAAAASTWRTRSGRWRLRPRADAERSCPSSRHRK